MKIELKEVNKNVVVKLLDGLKAIDQDKIIKKGINDALHLITVKGIMNLRDRYKGPSHTGALERSLIVRIKKTKMGGIAGFVDKAWYAYLVDRGSGTRQTKSGANRGAMTGNRFWRDAIESESDAAVDVLMKSISGALVKLEERARA